MAPSARHYIGLWGEDAERVPFTEERSSFLRRSWPAVVATGGVLGTATFLAVAVGRAAPQAKQAEAKPFLRLDATAELGPSGAAPPKSSFIVPLAPPPAPPPPAPLPPPALELTPPPEAPPPAAEPAPAAAPAPPVHHAPGECATAADNCWIKRCCENPKDTCFMKDATWAGCTETCTPGVHKTDPEFAQQPWNCYTVPAEGPAVPPAGAADPAPVPAAPAAPAAPPAPASGGGGKVALKPDGKYPTLFCFQIIRTGTYELDVVKKQKELGASIFGCEESVVLSDKPIDLGDGTTTLGVGDLSTGSGKETHFANTDIFSRSFDLLKEKGAILKHDFMVKVDPDAVFLAGRLKEHLRSQVPEAGANVYFQNCFFQDKNWMFGAIEVLSVGALNAYFGGRDNECRSKLDYDNMGEDTFLAQCLDLLGVEAKQDYDLLSDGYCSEAPGDCRSGQVTYHPFKDPGSWEACFNAASER